MLAEVGTEREPRSVSGELGTRLCEMVVRTLAAKTGGRCGQAPANAGSLREALVTAFREG